MLKHMHQFYSRLYKQFSEHSPAIQGNFDTYTLLVKYLWERYELKDVALRKCGEILAAAIKHTGDERVDFFAGALGAKEERVSPELLVVYLRLLRETQAGFEKLFSPDWNVVLRYEDTCQHVKRYCERTMREIG